MAELTPAEVRALWELRDDAILDARPRLWATWGFCPRHAWGQFTVELELRGLPPTTITLYEDLLRRAVEPAPDRLNRLRPSGGCPVCEGPFDEDAGRDARLVRRLDGAAGDPAVAVYLSHHQIMDDGRPAAVGARMTTLSRHRRGRGRGAGRSRLRGAGPRG